ncbi:hypothetical protein BKA61DRAFT_56137 [Leptodontidium sp. MPI-SDFR-AT-0119]|nr:hypothetical protein BKA61DRAFT_56137 [Leptodontidium sp. MPI-SDFR-AT-0119]
MICTALHVPLHRLHGREWHHVANRTCVLRTLLVFSGIFTFLVDAYPLYAASSLAANSFARSSFGGTFFHSHSYSHQTFPPLPPIIPGSRLETRELTDIPNPLSGLPPFRCADVSHPRRSMGYFPLGFLDCRYGAVPVSVLCLWEED